MKYVIALSIALFASFTQAYGATEKMDCVGVLTNNYAVNSQAFSLDTDEYELRNYGNDHLAFSIVMIRILLSEQGCKKTAINFGNGPFGRSLHKCQPMVRNRPFSNVCYVETNLGAFIVSTDFDTLVHIIYKSWD